MGDYKIDKSRSAIYIPGTINFPENTEIEALMTYTGTNPGTYVRQVTPTPESITMRLHHSFVKLPDDNYTPRNHDPRAGYGSVYFQDYAVPLDESIYIRYIRRHRLEKKNLIFPSLLRPPQTNNYFILEKSLQETMLQVVLI